MLRSITLSLLISLPIIAFASDDELTLFAEDYTTDVLSEDNFVFSASAEGDDADSANELEENNTTDPIE